MSAYQLHQDGDCGDSCPVCAQECAVCGEFYDHCTCPTLLDCPVCGSGGFGDCVCEEDEK